MAPPYDAPPPVPRCRPADRRYAGAMALPRKFLNEDEELLAELRPHWIFLFGPLFTSIGVWAAIIVLLVLWHNAPSWTNYPILIIAIIPGLWLLGRYRPLAFLRRGADLDPDPGARGHHRARHGPAAPAAHHRGQHPPAPDRAGARDGLADHRRAGRGRLADPGVHAQAGGRPARHQLADQRDRRRRSPRGDPGRHAAARSLRRRPTPTRTHDDADDTPPLRRGRGRPTRSGRPSVPSRRRPPAPRPARLPSEIRQRLIELDDLRRRGILSEEEFAAKKSQLLDRI